MAEEGPLLSDYRLNAQVRAVLVRRAIDLAKVEHGVTNGVIYLKGTLRCYMNTRKDDVPEDKQEEAAVAARLERSLRQIPGVRDVVFCLDRIQKVGWRWRSR